MGSVNTDRLFKKNTMSQIYKDDHNDEQVVVASFKQLWKTSKFDDGH